MLSWFCLLVFFFLSPNFMGLSSGCELGMGREGCRIISNTKGCHLIIKYCTYWAGTSYWALPRRSSMCLRPAVWPCFPLWDEERLRISDFPCNYLIQNLHYFGESLIWFKSQLWLFGNIDIVIFFLRGPIRGFLAEGFFRSKTNIIFKALIWRFFQAIDGNRSS